MREKLGFEFINYLLMEAQHQADYFIKILLLGDTGVGKSSLMSTYSEGEFPQNMVGTAGIDHKQKNIKHQGKLLKIQIWDTAGQEKYRSLTRKYYEGCSGIILVFDVTDKSSFEGIQEYWLQKIIENSDTNCELALVGNKTDLINDRQVSAEDAQHFL